jgi:hypothetical protein
MNQNFHGTPILPVPCVLMLKNPSQTNPEYDPCLID